MALRVQNLGGGITRVAPGNERTRAVRRRAAALGVAGVSGMGRAGEFQPGQGLSLSGILGGIGRGIKGAVTGFAAGGPAGGVLGGLGGIFGGGGGGGPQQFTGSSCPDGFVFRNGRCEVSGFRGTAERFLPGGSTGVLPGPVGGGEATVGAFGLPAMLPAQVGTVVRNNGTVGPILRCGAGMVLGKDDLCYPTQILTGRSRFRKHKKARRAPVTAADAEAIRRAARTKDRVKRLAKDVGLKMTTSRAPASRRLPARTPQVAEVIKVETN